MAMDARSTCLVGESTDTPFVQRARAVLNSGFNSRVIPHSSVFANTHGFYSLSAGNTKLTKAFSKPHNNDYYVWRCTNPERDS
jgi:hypothetical protein